MIELRGRPRKPEDNTLVKENGEITWSELREQWRLASAKYYAKFPHKTWTPEKKKVVQFTPVLSQMKRRPPHVPRPPEKVCSDMKLSDDNVFQYYKPEILELYAQRARWSGQLRARYRFSIL